MRVEWLEKALKNLEDEASYVKRYRQRERGQKHDRKVEEVKKD